MGGAPPVILSHAAASAALTRLDVASTCSFQTTESVKRHGTSILEVDVDKLSETNADVTILFSYGVIASAARLDLLDYTSIARVWPGELNIISIISI